MSDRLQFIVTPTPALRRGVLKYMNVPNGSSELADDLIRSLIKSAIADICQKLTSGVDKNSAVFESDKK